MVINNEIKPDITRNKRFYCVLKNPTVDYYDTKVIYGGSPEIVERKIQKQLKKWGVTNGSRKAI